MLNMSKKNIVLVVVVVLVVVGLAFTINKNNQKSIYSVVYLSTGDVYVGELSMLPRMELKNGYILATAPDPADPEKSNFQLNPISEALWAPQSIHLIKDNVVFYGSLLSTSKIAETLAGQTK